MKVTDLDRKHQSGKGFILLNEENISQIHAPDIIMETPGMMSRAERKMLFYFSSEEYLGKGYIIDGGSFFGSSVCATAEGLRHNKNFRIDDFLSRTGGEKPVHAFELGYLPAPKGEKVDRRRIFGGQEYFLGDSFVDILERSIRPYDDLVNINIGDFLNYKWKKVNNIEICFIDHAKTKDLNRHISRELYPSLSQGSILIHQDFYFDRLPWIKCTMGHFSENFEFLGYVFTSAIFRCVRPISEEEASFDPYTMASSDEKLSLHRSCHWDHLPPKKLFFLEISFAYLLALCGRFAEGLKHLDWIEKTFPDIALQENAARVNRIGRARRQIQHNRMNME